MRFLFIINRYTLIDVGTCVPTNSIGDTTSLLALTGHNIVILGQCVNNEI